ncbi:MAG TPA: hypothetical protein VGG45_16430 [Terracidiphilus sp.]
MKFLLSAISLLAFLAWAAARIALGIQFNIGCNDYISQAASSPDPSIAAQRLDAAISYADAHNLTSGNTGIFFTFPKNDVGFWYKRLTDSRAILRALPPGDAPLEVSNTLMRVRETLVEGGKDGDAVVSPSGISAFPDNAAFFWWGAVSFFALLLFTALAAVESDPF